MMKYIYPCVPNRIRPESKLFEELDKDVNWIGEAKRNGWRCIVYRDEDSLTLWTRRHSLIKEPLACLRAELLDMLAPGTIVDGELLEKRTKGIKELFYAFDILRVKGTDCHQLIWSTRRTILEVAVHNTDHIELSQPVQVGKKKLYYDSIGREDAEGVVLKQINSPYTISFASCLTNPMWIKVKEHGR